MTHQRVCVRLCASYFWRTFEKKDTWAQTIPVQREALVVHLSENDEEPSFQIRSSPFSSALVSRSARFLQVLPQCHVHVHVLGRALPLQENLSRSERRSQRTPSQVLHHQLGWVLLEGQGSRSNKHWKRMLESFSHSSTLPKNSLTKTVAQNVVKARTPWAPKGEINNKLDLTFLNSATAPSN